MKTLLFIIGFLGFFTLQSTFADKNLDSLRKYIPGQPGKDYPIYSPSILCKINPRNPGCGGKNGGGSWKKPLTQNRKPANQNQNVRGQIGKHAGSRVSSNGQLQGSTRKDYPTNSLAELSKRPGYENIKLAPSHLIVANYPHLNGNINRNKPSQIKTANSRPSSSRPTNSRPTNSRPTNSRPANSRPANSRPTNSRPSVSLPSKFRPTNSSPANSRPINSRPLNSRPLNSSPLNPVPTSSRPVNSPPTNLGPTNSDSGSSSTGGGGYCPGASFDNCIAFCPPNENDDVFTSCVSNCVEQCQNL